MAFKLHNEAKNWFKHLFGQPPLETLFDIYHICLLLGLTYERTEGNEEGLSEFMDEFIQRYRPAQSILVGSVVAVVLKRKGISVTEREAISKEISRIVSGDSSRGDLTAEGFREFNSYALGGFNLLRENFNYPPHDFAFFLKKYRSLLESSQEISI